VDDVALESLYGDTTQVVSISPKGGPHRGPVTVTLTAPRGPRIRYSLDGLSPTAQSSLYEKPIVLDKPGVWEVRAAVEVGNVLGFVTGALYDVTPEEGDKP
jgi:hypothetical protein